MFIFNSFSVGFNSLRHPHGHPVVFVNFYISVTEHQERGKTKLNQMLIKKGVSLVAEKITKK